VLQQLLTLRAADFRPTPALHITARINGLRPGAAAAAAAGGTAGGAGSLATGGVSTVVGAAATALPAAAGAGAGSPGGSSSGPPGPSGTLPLAISAASAPGAADDGSKSFYVDGSMDDSELGWNMGASGMSLSAPIARGRPTAAGLPQIREAHGEGADKTPHAGDSGGGHAGGGGGGGAGPQPTQG
jgi:hypothetical protein